MCLQTTWKKSKIATKNITVYKLLYITSVNHKRFLTSEFGLFKYEIGKVYKTRMLYTEAQLAYDDEAIIAINNETRKCKNIARGFHSALIPERFSKKKELKLRIFKCIIPKGARYFEGLSGLAVSSQIKIVKMVK